MNSRYKQDWRSSRKGVEKKRSLVSPKRAHLYTKPRYPFYLYRTCGAASVRGAQTIFNELFGTPNAQQTPISLIKCGAASLRGAQPPQNNFFSTPNSKQTPKSRSFVPKMWYCQLTSSPTPPEHALLYTTCAANPEIPLICTGNLSCVHRIRSKPRNPAYLSGGGVHHEPGPPAPQGAAGDPGMVRGLEARHRRASRI